MADLEVLCTSDFPSGDLVSTGWKSEVRGCHIRVDARLQILRPLLFCRLRQGSPGSVHGVGVCLVRRGDRLVIGPLQPVQGLAVRLHAAAACSIVIPDRSVGVSAPLSR